MIRTRHAVCSVSTGCIVEVVCKPRVLQKSDMNNYLLNACDYDIHVSTLILNHMFQCNVSRGERLATPMRQNQRNI